MSIVKRLFVIWARLALSLLSSECRLVVLLFQTDKINNNYVPTCTYPQTYVCMQVCIVVVYLYKRCLLQLRAAFKLVESQQVQLNRSSFRGISYVYPQLIISGNSVKLADKVRKWLGSDSQLNYDWNGNQINSSFETDSKWDSSFMTIRSIGCPRKAAD